MNFLINLYFKILVENTNPMGSFVGINYKISRKLLIGENPLL